MISKLTVLMPAYNEEANLIRLLPDTINFCQNNKYELVIVNDGSTDKTKEILSNYSEIQNFTIINNM